MRYLILTDIHANLEALEAVLSDAQARGYDETLVLGDLVGYGADPNAVVDCVRALQVLSPKSRSSRTKRCSIRATNSRSR